jgi:hypothetical protein
LFQSIEEVGEKLAEQSYVSDKRLEAVMNFGYEPIA